MSPKVPHLRAVDDATEPLAGDQALVDAAKTGDSAAWARLYQDNFDSLYRDARYLSQDASTAEELVQEAFALGLTRLSTYDGRSSFAGWIRGIIHNLTRQHWRKQERRGRAYATAQRTHEAGHTDVDDPERDLHRRQRATALARALQSLPASLRETFLLRDVQELSVDEVALRLQTTPGNVRVRANRARNKLRTLLEAQGALEVK